MYHDEEYLGLVSHILDEGVQKGDRTGTGTISLPFQQMRFDLSNHSIPLLTTKKMHTRSIIYEILWYLRGDTNIKYLNDNGVRIWDEWADENGDLGPIYGKQWRDWEDYPGHSGEESIGIDQIDNVVHQLKYNPDDRRILVSAWNVAQLNDMALPPCHSMFQFWSAPLEGSKQRQLRCHLYQRSADMGLGVPFNIVQYSILTHMMAKVTNHIATEFVWTGGDVHIYNNHIEQLKGQLELTPYLAPSIHFNRDIESIDDFVYEDFEIDGYDSHPIIKMPVAV